MRIAFIGDIVGRPGRKIIKEYLKSLREKYNIDLVIANGENASHGFGLTVKNCDELLKSGIDVITGGNHSFDKKNEILALLDTKPVLRPDNYPQGVPGSGVKIIDVVDEKLAIINLMGVYGMPNVENPFNHMQKIVEKLKNDGIKNIVVDFHGEATSEKRVFFMMYRNEICSFVGTHTHVGTDDLIVENGCSYVSDIGLTGCRDNVIGMDAKMPIYRATTGLNGHFEVPNNCKAILQMIVVDIENSRAINSFKIKKLCDKSEEIIQNAIIEE